MTLTDLLVNMKVILPLVALIAWACILLFCKTLDSDTALLGQQARFCAYPGKRSW